MVEAKKRNDRDDSNSINWLHFQLRLLFVAVSFSLSEPLVSIGDATATATTTATTETTHVTPAKRLVSG